MRLVIAILFASCLVAVAAPAAIQHNPWTTTTNDPTVTLQAQQPVSITTTNTLALFANGLIGWTNIVNGHINVCSPPFNAKGDGVSDDTASIQSALNWATNIIAAAGNQLGEPFGSVTLFFPPGKYRTTAPLRVFSFTHIVGDSRGAGIYADFVNTNAIYIGWNNNDPFAFTNAAPWRMSRNISIENFQIAGSNNKTNAHTAATVLNHGLRIDGLLHSQFRNLWIHDFGGSGIEDNRSEFCEFFRVLSDYNRIGLNKDGANATGDTTGLDNVTDTFRDCRFDYNNVGVRLVLTAANVFDRCEVEANVTQVFNATTDGTYNGPKLEPDAYYLPSVGVWLSTNVQNNTFTHLYVEANYVHVYFETNTGGIIGNQFTSCTFNPTEASQTDTEFCAKHDIYERLNLVNKSSVSDGTNNQAHVVFATQALGDQFQNCHFYNSPDPIAAAGKLGYKRIVFSTDNFSFPMFDGCFGLIFDDGTSVWSGVNPRVSLKIYPPTGQDSSAYLSGLAGAQIVNGQFLSASPTNSFVGAYQKTFSWDAAYVGANNLVQDGWLGDGASQRKTWRTLNHRAGLSTTPPTTGAWSQGDIVWNSGTTDYYPVGWKCTSAGTPGTWAPFGSYHISDPGITPDTSVWADFGVTRTNSSTNLVYIGMTKSGVIPLGLGIDTNNMVTLGEANNLKAFANIYARFGGTNSEIVHDLYADASIFVTGNLVRGGSVFSTDITAAGYLNATSGLFTPNNTYLLTKTSGGTYENALGLDGANTFQIGAGNLPVVVNGPLASSALNPSQAVITDGTKSLVSIYGHTFTNDVLVAGGTTNRMIFNYGICVTNIIGIYAP